MTIFCSWHVHAHTRTHTALNGPHTTRLRRGRERWKPPRSCDPRLPSTPAPRGVSMAGRATAAGKSVGGGRGQQHRVARAPQNKHSGSSAGRRGQQTDPEGSRTKSPGGPGIPSWRSDRGQALGSPAARSLPDRQMPPGGSRAHRAAPLHLPFPPISSPAVITALAQTQCGGGRAFLPPAQSSALTYQLHDAPAAASAAGLLAGRAELRQAARRGQGAQQLGGRGPEELLQELQRPGHHVVVRVLRVVQGQLVHLEGRRAAVVASPGTGVPSCV